ncbi:hypothetical protein HPB48_017033 [Haemaphysalis longicornis]|uniref:Speckle-type POZ protein n=1 Tax=Haemaphysalis longicornis TaxID=44386 RepID=A0A9J6FLJ0_HAELO|nr:hypothetical protein HPB48_017033 [Haemaphysalis longicornis]
MATKRAPTAMSANGEAPTTTDWCCTEVNVKKISYTWKMKNFSYLGSATGEKLESSTFPSGNDCGGHKWRLQLHPNGRCECCRGQVSLFLRLVPWSERTYRDILYQALFSEKIAHVKAWFHLLDSDLTYKYSREGSFDKLVSDSDTWGWKCFIRRDDLFAPEKGFLRDDGLRLKCDLHVVFQSVKNTSGQSTTHLFDIPTSQVSRDYGKLLDSGMSCDVVFKVGGIKIGAHKVILAARCPVFASMFKHDMLENTTNEVEIPDIGSEVFREMLRFVYTGEAPNLQKFPMQLLVAADKHLLERLKAMCEKVIGENLRVDTVAKTLLFADLHSANQLKAHAIDFICKHGEAVRNTDGWKDLGQRQNTLVFEVLKRLLDR